MRRLLALAILLAPLPALARRSSSGTSSSDAGALAVLVGLLFIVMIVFMAISRSKTTIRRPDGTTTEVPSSTSRSPAGLVEPARPTKRLVGPTTITYPSFQARSAAVQNLKEKYGSAIRIVHRAKLQQRDAWGRKDVYTLVLEVPVKCPDCGETYAVDDFGLTDCPSCGKELAVYFDEGTRKRKVGVVRDGKIYEPARKTPSRARGSGPEQVLDASSDPPIEARFSKIEK